MERKDGVLRVPFASFNKPGIGRNRRKRHNAKQVVHRLRRQAGYTAADIQSKKAVLRIEGNDDALVADGVVADTAVPTTEDAVHSRLPKGAPQEPLTSVIVTVRAEKRKAAVVPEKGLEVAAPVKGESRYSANAIARFNRCTHAVWVCGCMRVRASVAVSLSVCTCLLVLFFSFHKLARIQCRGGRLVDYSDDSRLTARPLPLPKVQAAACHPCQHS